MSLAPLPDRPAPGDVHAWVRVVEGRLVVAWLVAADGGWRSGGTRPMTLAERVAWRLSRRVPKVEA